MVCQTVYAPCSSLNKRRRQTHTEEKTSAISPRGEVYDRCPVFAGSMSAVGKIIYVTYVYDGMRILPADIYATRLMQGTGQRRYQQERTADHTAAATASLGCIWRSTMMRRP